MLTMGEDTEYLANRRRSWSPPPNEDHNGRTEAEIGPIRSKCEMRIAAE